MKCWNYRLPKSRRIRKTSISMFSVSIEKISTKFSSNWWTRPKLDLVHDRERWPLQDHYKTIARLLQDHCTAIQLKKFARQQQNVYKTTKMFTRPQKRLPDHKNVYKTTKTFKRPPKNVYKTTKKCLQDHKNVYKTNFQLC